MDNGSNPLVDANVRDGTAKDAGPNNWGGANSVDRGSRVTASNGGANVGTGIGSGDGVRAGLVGLCCGGERVRRASTPASSVPSSGTSSSSGNEANSQSTSAEEAGRLVCTGNALDIVGHAVPTALDEGRRP